MSQVMTIEIILIHALIASTYIFFILHGKKKPQRVTKKVFKKVKEEDLLEPISPKIQRLEKYLSERKKVNSDEDIL